MANIIDILLTKLDRCIAEDRHESVETDGVEIKPVPSSSGEWKEIHKTTCAFLNTRGGILLLGFKETTGRSDPSEHRWQFTGWQEHAEAKLKELPKQFTGQNGEVFDMIEWLPPMQLRPFRDGQVAIVYIDELPADKKFVTYKGTAYKRVLTGDHKIKEAELEAQANYREELWNARELQTIPGVSEDQFDLDVLNEYIQHLNRPVKIETIKADISSARPFLSKKGFMRDDMVTTLGILVCGRSPEDILDFRCHVHGYVDVPQQIAQDKQDLIDNILPLMERSLAYILRNIQIGISAEGGGSSTPQYPEDLLRETVNNALAHRDYSINKQVLVSIKPGSHIMIKNPGKFRSYLLIEHVDDTRPLRRIIPEAKARNPKLADVLRVYRKWEGKGIGMATMVNMCLENRIDLPTYRLYSEEVALYLNAGPLLGERMEHFFESFDRYIEDKLNGAPTKDQKLVLSYLIKAEWANRRHYYTIMLTPDNNHFEQLLELEEAGLIHKHARSTPLYPIYMPDEELMRKDYEKDLLELFGEGFKVLEPKAKACLNALYRAAKFSKKGTLTAKRAAFALWYDSEGSVQDIKAFDTFYRKIRYIFNKLESGEYILKAPEGKTGGYQLNENYLKERLL